MTKGKWLLLIAVIVVGVIAYLGWKRIQPAVLPRGFAVANGRTEAVEIDIAAKQPGRLLEVKANEGEFIVAGQVLAVMDTEVLSAELREAEAELRRSKTAIDTAQSNVVQREAEKRAAESVVLQREAELDLQTIVFGRAKELVEKSAVSREEYDRDRAALYSAKAALATAQANVAGTDAAITTAKSQVIQAEASVDSAQARIERLQADIKDCVLKSPRDGRVQFRIAEPGEVLGAGGKVLNLVDLGDVYMTFFLPEAEAGRIRLGTEVRLVLDAAPQFVFPAKVTFVSDVAQFTPKTVETAVERQKLTFRIKAHLSPELLKKYIRNVKTGVPGMAHVQLDPQAEWPANLAVRLPPQ